ncbi:hypothetical protein BDR04DRAFT_1095048, partial [Suillus decipiens]
RKGQQTQGGKSHHGSAECSRLCDLSSRSACYTWYKVTEKKDLWLQVHLPCIKAVSPAFSVKPISYIDKTLACHQAMYNIMGDDRKNRPSCSSTKGLD